MLISIIAAIDSRGLLGDEAGLPWHLPKDLRRFRAYTWGKPIVMGRRTFELIGKPLPGRLNIVLTHNPMYNSPGCQVARRFPEALAIAEDYLKSVDGEEVMIIGGGKVYEEALQRWDRLYLTVVEGQFKGTVYFPVRELLRQRWRPICDPEMSPPDEKNSHRHSFYIIERDREATPSAAQLDQDNLTPKFADSEEVLARVDLATTLSQGTIGREHLKGH